MVAKLKNSVEMQEICDFSAMYHLTLDNLPIDFEEKEGDMYNKAHALVAVLQNIYDELSKNNCTKDGFVFMLHTHDYGVSINAAIIDKNEASLKCNLAAGTISHIQIAFDGKTYGEENYLEPFVA